MNSKGFSADFWVQFGILSLMGVTIVGSVILWVDSRYAKASEVVAITQEVNGLSSEVHELYIHLIPEPERKNGR